MKNKIEVSVVVCSYNGEHKLKECLTALLSQTMIDRIEIIVVNDGSSDNTAEVASLFKQVKLITNQRNLGLAAARNVGIKAAKGAIIAFTDDDCRPHRDWIKQLIKVYSVTDALGVGGNTYSKSRDNVVLRYLRHNNPLMPLEYNIFTSKGLVRRFVGYLKSTLGVNRNKQNRRRVIYSFTGCNMSFKKDILDQVGLFDEAFSFGGEDQEICRRINLHYPKRLYLAPKALIVHQFNKHLSDTLRRSKSYGIGNARLARKYRVMSHTIFPFPMLVILSSLLALINPWLLVSPFILTIMLYPMGLRRIIEQRSLEPIVYGYIQLLQEMANNIGYVIGWWRYRHTFRTSLSDITAPNSDIQHLAVSSKVNSQSNRSIKEAGLILALLIVSLVATFIKSTTLLHIPIAITLVIISGYLLFRAFGGYSKRRQDGMLRLALITALGIFWLMLVGLLIDIILPVFGIKQPLTYKWLWLIFGLTTAALIPWSLKQPKVAKKAINKLQLHWETLLMHILLVMILLLSFIGARLLNNGFSNIAVLIGFGCSFIALIFAVIKQKRLPNYILPLTLFVISLASVWSYSLRSNYVFGFDIQQEYQVFLTTLKSGNWALGAKHVPYSAMLSLTVFPVILSKLSGVSGLTIYKVLVPMIFSFVPVLLFYIYKQFSRSWIAFTASMIIIAQFYYMQQFSGEVRQQIAFIFFAAILYLLLQKNQLTKSTKNWLLGIFLISLVVSHYSTTYLAIILFAGTYLITKILIYLKKDRTNKKAANKAIYIKGWVVVLLCLATGLWYGPATQSYGNLQSFNKVTSLNQIIATIKEDATSLALPSRSAPANTQIYLNDIAKYYHNNNNFFKYYPKVNDSGIIHKPIRTIKSPASWLTTLVNILNIVYSYGYWILGSIGIGVLLVYAYRRLDFKNIELGIVGVIGVMAFVSIHIIPALQVVYNPSRLNEQVLMVVALPSTLIFIWLLQKLFKDAIKYISIVAVGIAFLLAAGVITQFSGGKPTANLNNYGVDYSSLYVHQTDLAAVAWLGNHYDSTSTVYADDNASNFLQAAGNVNHGIFIDVTPETIAEGSYVFADYTNVKDSIASSAISGKTYNYTFPTHFLADHKDLLYTNGSARIYK